jgi:hypothetical protein
VHFFYCHNDRGQNLTIFLIELFVIRVITVSIVTYSLRSFVQEAPIPVVSHGSDLGDLSIFVGGKRAKKILRRVLRKLLKLMLTLFSRKTSSQFHSLGYL